MKRPITSPSPERSFLSRVAFFAVLTLVSFFSAVSVTSAEGVPFGINHTSSCDSALANGGFVKNWWDHQGGPSSLASQVSSNQACGQMETPLIVANWDGVSPSAIQSAMTSFFNGNKNVPIWEMGREENLGNGDGCCSSSQLSLLYNKLSAVKAARTAAGNPPVRIAYQIANMGLGTYQTFLNSTAAGLIDILAPHPYPWTDFPTPETWLNNFVNSLNGYIANSPYANKNMAIMFTEVGAPVCDTNPSGCTMDENGPIRGQGQQENAEYVVKVHVMALNAGVEKVYWYHMHHTSSGPDPVCGTGSYGEDCFSMVNANGPRQAYYAYKTMTACMEGKSSLSTFRSPSDGVRVYEFTGTNGSCIIAWTYKDGVTERVVPKNPILSVPMSSITSKAVSSVLDTTGNPISYNGTLSPAPIFIQTLPGSSTPTPTAALSANPTSITRGQSSTLTWGSTNATSCTGAGFSTGNAVSGSTAVAPATTTAYSVSCTGSGGTASASAAVTVTLASTDTTAPSISLTSPTNRSTVSGTVTVSSNASDNVGVTGVQFKLDGANLGTEDTTSPYNISWNTTTATNSSHALTAVARDAAGNTTTSSGVSVAVNNVAPSLLAHWKFDGNATDSAGGDDNGTITGATFVTGKYGQALNLDGNDSVNIPDKTYFSPSVNDLSVSGWIKIPTNASSQGNGACRRSGRYFVAKGGSSNWEWGFENDRNNRLCFNTYTLSGSNHATVSVSRTMNDNVWHHYAATVDDGVSLKLYVDGNLVATQTTFSGTMGNGTNPLQIGRRGDGNYFIGQTDDVRVFKRALTASEITILYNGGNVAEAEAASSTSSGQAPMLAFKSGASNQQRATSNQIHPTVVLYR